MTIKELKSDIENNSVSDGLLIFVNTDNSFIAEQYTKQIAKNKNTSIINIESLDSLQPDKVDIFGVPSKEEGIKLVKVDKLSYPYTGLQTMNNLIIIANSIDTQTQKLYNDFIVVVPKLEKWQIKEYATMRLSGVTDDIIDKFLSVCQYNIFRVCSEMEKFESFRKEDIPMLFRESLENGALSDVTELTAYDLTNAIQKKDVYGVKSCLYDINNIDLDPVGFISLLISGFRKMILVWLQQSPSESTTGLKSNQIWAINKIPKRYSKEQLIYLYKFLTDMDFRVKSGEIDSKDVIDYMLVKILSI